MKLLSSLVLLASCVSLAVSAATDAATKPPDTLYFTTSEKTWKKRLNECKSYFKVAKVDPEKCTETADTGAKAGYQFFFNSYSKTVACSRSCASALDIGKSVSQVKVVKTAKSSHVEIHPVKPQDLKYENVNYGPALPKSLGSYPAPAGYVGQYYFPGEIKPPVRPNGTVSHSALVINYKISADLLKKQVTPPTPADLLIQETSSSKYPLQKAVIKACNDAFGADQVSGGAPQCYSDSLGDLSTLDVEAWCNYPKGVCICTLPDCTNIGDGVWGYTVAAYHPGKSIEFEELNSGKPVLREASALTSYIGITDLSINDAAKLK